MPESGRKTLIDMLLKPQVLLVMAHHNAPQIRVAVVKVLKHSFLLSLIRL